MIGAIIGDLAAWTWDTGKSYDFNIRTTSNSN